MTLIWRGPGCLLALALQAGLLQGWSRRGTRGTVAGAASSKAEEATGGARRLLPVTLAASLLIAAQPAHAATVVGSAAVLPAGSDLGEGGVDSPRERFRSDYGGGERSYLVRLGDVAFSAPSLLGSTARQAGISCATCHSNGASNPALYVPGLSSKPGNFDTTSGLFNPAADDHVRNPVRIPSLRGARLLAPYGHDGRSPSLRDFVRNVVVGEFAGAEPSPQILDALVAYIQDIDFLPNPRLGETGQLAASASALERRGEALFNKPFPHDPALSCAACHKPTAAFVDHGQHDVGSDGIHKTPTLLNANFNAPYFHDGRYDTYEEVVGHFDRVFDLGLDGADRAALVAYLQAIGDGDRPFEQAGVDEELVELEFFVSVLDRAIALRDVPVITLTVDTVIGELRELIERFPERKNTVTAAGKAERAAARASLKQLALDLRRVELAAEAGEFDEAAATLVRYRTELAEATPGLEDAEPYSLFNPDLNRAYSASLEALHPITR